MRWPNNKPTPGERRVTARLHRQSRTRGPTYANEEPTYANEEFLASCTVGRSRWQIEAKAPPAQRKITLEPVCFEILRSHYDPAWE